VAAATAPPAAVAEERRSGATEDKRNREDDRRGGRRRRRRPRTGGNRGLPESKFYTPAAGDDEPPPPVAASGDFAVLPGESLAKYARGEDVDAAPDIAEDAQPDTEIANPPEAEAEPVGDTAPATEAPEMASYTGEHSGQIEEPALPEMVFSPANANVESREEVDELADEPAELLTEAAEPDPPVEEPLEEPAAEAPLEFDDAAMEESAPSPESEDNPFDESGASEEDVEPARIPTSLTAALREQGGRYGHRVSRRMRRRGGRPQEERPARPERPPRPEQQAEQRPERTEKADRATRAERPQPSISDLLREGQEIIVQIAKEPLGQKGARITSHIALPGRFLVYMPTVDHIGVSRKIASDEERQRLKRVLQAHRTGIPGGFIVRTAGEGHTEEELKADMLFLYNLWLDLRQKAEKRPAPALMHHDLNVVERVLRDQLTTQFKSIWVDNEEVYENVLSFVQRFQPALVGRVKMYTRPTPIFDEFGITPELEKALRPKVWLKSGGYIVLNQTEALVAIDVNTGKYVGKSNRLEDTIVKTNTDAIREIVRQIRLRDLGGIIVVDFIDMDERKNRQKVMQSLEEAMRADRAPNKILSFNDFGLVAITRKRVKQSLERTLCAPCPYCEGAAYVKSVNTIIGEIIVEAQKIAKAVEGRDVTLRVNPEVARVLKSNRNTYLQELEEILRRNVVVRSDPLLHQERFDLT
jgi:ribonuclease G